MGKVNAKLGEKIVWMERQKDSARSSCMILHCPLVKVTLCRLTHLICQDALLQSDFKITFDSNPVPWNEGDTLLVSRYPSLAHLPASR